MPSLIWTILRHGINTFVMTLDLVILLATTIIAGGRSASHIAFYWKN
jgi:hypothetical protein